VSWAVLGHCSMLVRLLHHLKLMYGAGGDALPGFKRSRARRNRMELVLIDRWSRCVRPPEVVVALQLFQRFAHGVILFVRPPFSKSHHLLNHSKMSLSISCHSSKQCHQTHTSCGDEPKADRSRVSLSGGSSLRDDQRIAASAAHHNTPVSMDVDCTCTFDSAI
jgi:hypothetical protein